MNLKSSTTVIFGKCRTMAVVMLLGSSSAMFLASPGTADANAYAKVGNIQQTEQQKQELSEQWGIELIAMRSTGYNFMIDFRYKVLDAEKAAPLFKRKTKPYLIHQDSGKALAVPNTAKLGSLRNSNIPQQDRTYWMFFGNSQGFVKKGDKVTVAIGDFRAKDIEVQ